MKFNLIKLSPILGQNKDVQTIILPDKSISVEYFDLTKHRMDVVDFRNMNGRDAGITIELEELYETSAPIGNLVNAEVLVSERNGVKLEPTQRYILNMENIVAITGTTDNKDTGYSIILVPLSTLGSSYGYTQLLVKRTIQNLFTYLFVE